MKGLSGIALGVVTFVALKISEEAIKDLWPILKDLYKHVDWFAVVNALKTELQAQKILLDPVLLFFGFRYVLKGSEYAEIADKFWDFTVILVVVTTGSLFVLLGFNIALGNDQVLQSLAGRRFGMAVDATIVLLVFTKVLLRTRKANRKKISHADE